MQGTLREGGGSLGFTLLELLVVIAIVGLLSAFVGPKYFAQIGKSERVAAKSQLEAFSRALGAYRLDAGSFPSTELGLKVLVERPSDAGAWNGPYLDKSVPLDPWGRPYIYRSPAADGGDYDLLTLGKDGQLGGSGEAEDIKAR